MQDIFKFIAEIKVGHIFTWVITQLTKNYLFLSSCHWPVELWDNLY